MDTPLHAQRFLRATGFAEFCEMCTTHQLGLRQLVQRSRSELEDLLGIADKIASLALHHDLSTLRSFVDGEGCLISAELPNWLATVLQLDEKQLASARQARSLSARPATSR